MIAVKRFFCMAVLLSVLSVFFACAGKQQAKPAPQQSVTVDAKDEVLRLINDNIPNICEYHGRTNMKFSDGATSKSFAANLSKECRSSDMSIKILGPFGIGLADLVVKGGSYSIIQGGKDVTQSYPLNVTSSDIVALNNLIPPPVPDSSFAYTVDQYSYMFTRNGDYISVTSDFYVNMVKSGDSKVDYVWEGGLLKSTVFSRGNTELTVEYLEQWK